MKESMLRQVRFFTPTGTDTETERPPATILYKNKQKNFDMNKIPESQILIIFGASGDLTHRKLIPSLFELFERKLLPDKFLIVGVSRTKQSTEEFRQSLHSSIIGNGKTYATDNPYLKNFLREIYYISCDTTDCNAYVALFREIEQCAMPPA